LAISKSGAKQATSGRLLILGQFRKPDSWQLAPNQCALPLDTHQQGALIFEQDR